MPQKLLIFLLLAMYSCTSAEESSLNSKQSKILTGTITQPKITALVTEDSLIAKLAHMKTKNLDSSAKIYWEIIQKGEIYIPKLIKSLTDTTTSNIYNHCKKGKLNIGEISYFALNEIAEFPAFAVTGIQFCVIDKNGCWQFLDYLFEDKNKSSFQSKIEAFYLKNQKKYHFKKYTNDEKTDCYIKYSINGQLKLQQ